MQVALPGRLQTARNLRTPGTSSGRRHQSDFPEKSAITMGISAREAG